MLGHVIVNELDILFGTNVNEKSMKKACGRRNHVCW